MQDEQRAQPPQIKASELPRNHPPRSWDLVEEAEERSTRYKAWPPTMMPLWMKPRR